MINEYVKQLEKFNLKKIVNFSLLLFIFSFIVSLFLSYFVNDNSLNFNITLLKIVLLILFYIALLILHEGIHAISFIIFGKAKKGDVSFGVILKHGMIYCTTKRPLTASAYKISLLTPIIFTGIIPLVIFIISGNVGYIFLFSLMVSGGAGDLIMFNRIRKYPSYQLILDHPKAPAFYLVYEKGNEPEGFIEVTEEQEKEVLEELNKIKKKKTS